MRAIMENKHITADVISSLMEQQRILNEARKRRTEAIVELVLGELAIAEIKHPAGFHSLHEAYAVLKEEVDELWYEIKKQKPNHATVNKEACQVAAMAIRTILECLEDE
jgi:hypothetical protein